MKHKKKKISLVMVFVSLAQEKGTWEKERLGRDAEKMGLGRGIRMGDRGKERVSSVRLPAGPKCIHSTSGLSVRALLTLRCS